MNITVETSEKPRPRPTGTSIPFGQFFSDHMFSVKHSSKEGWHEPSISPFDSFSLSPAASVLHYGQALFEGMKAYVHASGSIALFRPEFNFARMRAGAERLCMPFVTQTLFTNGIERLVQIDRQWIPSHRGSSLYIRPTLIGTEGFLGVRPSNEVLFFIITSPAGAYFAESTVKIKIWIEQRDVRAAPGGLGATKAAANYASSLRAAVEAKSKGYSQVLWLDVNREYVEEVGTMNVFFVFDDEIATPALDGTILSGCTRDSVLQLLRRRGLSVRERKVSLKEITDGLATGRLKEAFGTGTAAVISPIAELGCEAWTRPVGTGETGPLTKSVYDEIVDIQTGKAEDPFQWLHLLPST